MTDSGDVNLDRVQLIMSDLGNMEDEIFKKRQQTELAFKQREKNKKRRMDAISNFKPNWIPSGQFSPTVSSFLNLHSNFNYIKFLLNNWKQKFIDKLL